MISPQEGRQIAAELKSAVEAVEQSSLAPETRESAYIQAVETIDRIRARLGERNERRQQALLALASHSDSRVTEAVLACVDDPNLVIRAFASRALAGRKEPGVTGALLARLHDPELLVRQEAVLALQDQNSRETMYEIIALLSDEIGKVAWAAADALLPRTGPRPSLPWP